MPNWIKTKDRLPSEDGSYFVIGKMGRGSISFRDGEWNKDNPHFQVFVEVLEWLDESEPSFTIEDITLAYNTGWRRGYNHNYDEADRYLKQQYNIDINK